jgi:L-glutamine-phosphate cytidylyltransferase
MKAVILAAGQGTRLMPLTATKPKCMVPLFGKPLLSHLIDTIRGAGISDITVIAGYRHDQVAAAAPGCNIVLNRNYASSNMVTTLFCADHLFRDPEDDLLVSYSDILYESKVIEAVKSSEAPVAVAVNEDWRALWLHRMDDPLADAETMKRDDNGSIRELGKKARSYEDVQGQYMGLFKVRGDHVPKLRAVYDAMDRGTIYDGQPFANLYMTSLLQHLIDLGWPVKAAPVHGGWLEVDTIEDWKLYQRLAEEGALDPIYRAAR